VKKIIIILLSGMILLNLNSCKRETEGYSIIDALKISAFTYNENSGEDYFVYDDWGNIVYNVNENTYELTPLKMNEPKIMRPMGLFVININMRFEFDGIIKVAAENKDMQMFVNPDIVFEPVTGTTGNGNEPYGFEMKFSFDGYIAANPLGSNCGHLWVTDGTRWLRCVIGREYYVDVNAYKFDNEESAVISAQLKLVQLDDKTSANGNFSRCYSIGLISYEYSDIYKMMYEIDDEY